MMTCYICGKEIERGYELESEDSRLCFCSWKCIAKFLEITDVKWFLTMTPEGCVQKIVPVDKEFAKEMALKEDNSFL